MTKPMIKKIVYSLSLITCGAISVIARENVDKDGVIKKNPSDAMKVMAGCTPGTSQTEIKLNNVRTRILTAGDMWWDLSNAKYEIPKNSNSYSCFAGSLWFGGKVGSQLRVSAMTYRQTGVDFWPGPLDPNSVDIDAATCNRYDKHWRFNRADVDKFYSEFVTTGGKPSDPYYQVPSWITNYPGSAPVQDPKAQFYYLAPFFDADNDLAYDPAKGDYPAYNVKGTSIAYGNCKKMLFGDETLFWVFNDKGNIHTETASQAQIGVEIRAQAFEFATGDELNDMTFYNFEIINRSTNKLDSTYFAVWVDADLGNYTDDYIGCDVGRGLGYIYNGDNYDDDSQGQTGYHGQLPALGCDFFQGPNADVGDGIDNDRDGCIDCTYEKDPITGAVIIPYVIVPDNQRPEQIIMSRFTYYNNDGNPKNGNPTTAGNGIQFYNLMKGLWKDGSPMTYGGNGIGGSIPCKFLYPDNTDPAGAGTGGVPQPAWNEVTAANTKGDRRFLQSAGQFTLQPGAVNYITFGMPWVRTASNNNFDAIPLLQSADDKAQALFDQCFKVLDGPDAPDLTIQEMENELFIYLTNKPASNNYEQKRYHEIDVSIASIFPYGTNQDSTYKFYDFEGYMVYQLKDGTVSQTDLDNPDKARLVFQCDKKNGASKLVNYYSDPVLGSVPKLMTPRASDNGIMNSFTVTEDLFAEGSKRLVNHKTYYYMAVSYAYNNYLTYKQDVPPPLTGPHPSSGDSKGQKKPFLRGRRNIKAYAAIPHNISPEANGTVLNSYFGYGPKVTRIEGQGAGGYAVDLTKATIDKILTSPTHRVIEAEYENARGPIYVKVIDPLNVVGGDFKLKIKRDSLGFMVTPRRDANALFKGGMVSNNLKWTLEGSYKDKNNNSYNKTWSADVAISVGQEQILVGDNGEPIGISVTVNRSEDPERAVYENTGETLEGDLLESSMTFSGVSWLTGLRDADGQTPRNWIRSGQQAFPGTPEWNDYFQKQTGAGQNGNWYADPKQVWENVVGGTWAPFRMVSGSQPDAGPIETAPAPFNPQFPQYNCANNNITMDARNLASVDIVFTADKSKWTRCPVLELCHNSVNAVGKQFKFFKRLSPSVDKDGKSAPGGNSNSDPNSPNFIDSVGMGWFPGYAINVETGERLNILFGENSSDVLNNGNDMLWNPTSNTYTMTSSGNKFVFGGMHYIYVFGHNSDGVKSGIPIDVARYDYGKSANTILKQSLGTIVPGSSNAYNKILELYKDAMWVNIPLLNSGYKLTKQSDIPNDAKVRIRVKKPLRYGLSGGFSPAYSQAGNFKLTYLDSISTTWNYRKPNAHTVDTLPAAQAKNNNFPMYTFNTWSLVTRVKDEATAKDALSLINVVPNPYYGHSAYEKQRIDTYVKIVNLPPKCNISIYTINGTLIRTIKKDTDVSTEVYWDLKNSKNLSVASGLYIIHIDAPGIGEKILKWFGVMRPMDLQSY